MLRVRAYRDNLASVFRQFHDHLAKQGIDSLNLEDKTEENEDSLKCSHLLSIRKSILEFSNIIAQKHFVLLEAPKDRYFYLGDNPVALMNDEPADKFWGNIGLAVKGIQIYVPLTSKLMLAAWCPSIIDKLKDGAKESRFLKQQLIAQKRIAITRLESVKSLECDKLLSDLEVSLNKVEEFVLAVEVGKPMMLNDDNMDRYNALQVQSAREFIVCQNADFDLARKVVAKEGSESRIQMKVG